MEKQDIQQKDPLKDSRKTTDRFDASDADGPAEGPKTTRLSGMYQDWFLDYASYVIMERAVPEIRDGLKPVQRRILHAMKELDDGRYNKVANIIGHTMKYHPHGDASIGDALVQLGQKDLLIDTQGNWGNILTGDSAAAPRYIEARPSRFALEVLYNPKTTRWKSSYDGRNREPLSLPVKFPLLLAQGVEGIAVGLASKILPHNFNELIDASIAVLQGKEPDMLPDFPSGGLADFSRYNQGQRGGKVRIRARIQIVDKKTLMITEIPYGTHTGQIMDSIVAANDKGKIKVRKIEDNTAEKVEIMVHLAPGISPDQAIDALYLFTDCEISISPNCCVIDTDRPRFMSVNEVLKTSTEHTLELLKRELEIEKHELLEQLFFSSLERLFIEKRIYRKIENCETWEAVTGTIDQALKPHRSMFYREITHEDIVRLTEIRIKRISRYDAFKAEDLIRKLEEKLAQVEHHLQHLVAYAVAYFRQIREKYGQGRGRKTEIRLFDTIEAARVAVANEKLYVNRTEGFVGTGLKKDEYVCECSDLDEIIVFREDGSFVVTRVAEKTFLGKGIIHVGVFDRNDDRTIYNMMYRDGTGGTTYMKRFAVKGITRDKEYQLTRGTKGSKVLYFSANPNGEAETVSVYLRPRPKLRRTQLDVDFRELVIKGRGATGNMVTKHPVRKVVLKDEGVSTLGAMDIWFDDAVLRLNADKRGQYLGAFKGDDKILVVYASGMYRIMGYELSSHFDEKPLLMQKYDPEQVMSVVYRDGESGLVYLKRFVPEPNGKFTGFIGEHPESQLMYLSTLQGVRLQLRYPASGRRQKTEEWIAVDEFIAVKSYRARGKRVSSTEVEAFDWVEPEEEIGEEPMEPMDPIEPMETVELPEDDVEAMVEARGEAVKQADTKAEREAAKETTPAVPESKESVEAAVPARPKAKGAGKVVKEASPPVEKADKDVAKPEEKPRKKAEKKAVSKKKAATPQDKQRQIRLDLDI